MKKDISEKEIEILAKNKKGYSYLKCPLERILWIKAFKEGFKEGSRKEKED